MMYHSITTVFFLCFILIASVGIIILQMFLSKKEDKRVGLILPIISFIISFMPAVSNTITLLNLEVAPGFEISIFSPQLALVYANAFLFLNIPTTILASIYVVYRKKHNRLRALDKMTIQDLE